MRITESNVMLWGQLRSEDAGAQERERVDDARQARATAIVHQLNVLDTDHDGWLDEDDLPYDQLMLLERERARDAAEAARQTPAAKPLEPVAEPAPAPAAAASGPPPVDVTTPPAPAPEAPPRVDLLA